LNDIFRLCLIETKAEKDNDAQFQLSCSVADEEQLALAAVFIQNDDI